MASQPTRPWFRLASIARPPAAPATVEAPAPPQVPEPRPAVARPTFRPSVPSLPIQGQEPTPPPTAAPPATAASFPSFQSPRASAPSTAPPVTSTSSVPSPPKTTTTVAATSSSVVPAPPRPTTTVAATSSPTPRAAAPSAARVPSPIPPPKTIVPPAAETPPQSSKPKPTAPPPSPLILPPSQMKSTETEPEQKTVLFQKTIEKPKPWLGGNGGDQTNYNKPSIIRNGVEQDVESKEKGSHHRKKVSDSEEMGMRVITIAGENKGAIMELIHSPQKHGVGDHHNKKGMGNTTKTQSRGSDSESSNTSSDKEGKPKKDKSQKGKATTSLPMNAFMNSNVQSINNSLLYHCSCTHHDPGVHLALSRKPSGEFQVKDRVNNGGHN